jgi:hypothetical protein
VLHYLLLILLTTFTAIGLHTALGWVRSLVRPILHRQRIRRLFRHNHWFLMADGSYLVNWTGDDDHLVEVFYRNHPDTPAVAICRLDEAVVHLVPLPAGVDEEDE